MYHSYYLNELNSQFNKTFFNFLQMSTEKLLKNLAIGSLGLLLHYPAIAVLLGQTGIKEDPPNSLKFWILISTLTNYSLLLQLYIFFKPESFGRKFFNLPARSILLLIAIPIFGICYYFIIVFSTLR